MLELLLAVLTLAAWYGFLRLLRKGRAVTRAEVIVHFTGQMQRFAAGLALAASSARKATEAMQAFNKAWAEAAKIDRG